MTPEERARATLSRRADDVDRYLRAKVHGHKPPTPASVEAYFATAIREAENEALESAARDLDTEAEMNGSFREGAYQHAAFIVRSFKHPSAKEGGK